MFKKTLKNFKKSEHVTYFDTIHKYELFNAYFYIYLILIPCDRDLVNPCAARTAHTCTGYTFSRKFQIKYNSTAIDRAVFGRCSANQITQFFRCLFFINNDISYHLKLEIASAIPALNN